MTRMGYRALFACGLLLCAAGAAQAQRNYDVKTMNFGIWCQETQHWPTDRCDKRLPDDVNTFEAFRATIENYEIPYLQKQNRDARLDADIVHSDPVDRSPVRTAQPPPTSQEAPPQTPQ
jgi:hypothetical protein